MLSGSCADGERRTLRYMLFYDISDIKCTFMDLNR